MAIIIALCTSLLSCDLFKTRTPAEPSQQRSSWTPAFEPTQVMQNIINAFQDGNSVNYAKSFSDVSFSFEASAKTNGKYNNELTNWNKAKEQKYFENTINHFSSNNSKVVLTFDPYTPNTNASTSQVQTSYHLILPADAGMFKRFNGELQFTLTRDQDGYWYINQWVDIGTDSTWSDLKGVAYLLLW